VAASGEGRVRAHRDDLLADPGGGVQNDQQRLSAGLWWVGAVSQLALALSVLQRWMGEAPFTIAQVHPAWFIPVVGNLVVPLAGTTHAPADISWFFFGVGLLYWLVLTPLILFRVILADALPDRLRPTLAILIAPPAVAALAWDRLGGSPLDPFGRILLSAALFQALLLATQALRLIRVPFAIPTWAYTFPLAALTSALLTAARTEGAQTDAGQLYQGLGGTSLGLLSVLVVVLSARTVVAVRRLEICRPD
jgi:tellurite resistance protein